MKTLFTKNETLSFANWVRGLEKMEYSELVGENKLLGKWMEINKIGFDIRKKGVDNFGKIFALLVILFIGLMLVFPTYKNLFTGLSVVCFFFAARAYYLIMVVLHD